MAEAKAGVPAIVATTTDNAIPRFDGVAGQMQTSSATIGDNGDLTLSWVDATATGGPGLLLYRDSSSPAASDTLGFVTFRGEDSAGNTQDYATIVTTLVDPTSTSEDARLLLQAVLAGTMTTALTIAGGTSYFTSNLLVGKSTADTSTVGIELPANGIASFTAASASPIIVNRGTSDGTLVSLRQDNAEEGVISVSGTTITYASFCGAHWSQLADDTNPDLPRGTILDTIDDMCAWPGEENDQLARFKVSDTAGSASVYGVFCNWTEKGDANIASLGAFLVRINAGVTVSRGDLIESNGDGTGRVQSDDVIRSRTVAKVTSSHVVETFADGSYLVPCTLHCG
jgi:hypothetical protein